MDLKPYIRKLLTPDDSAVDYPPKGNTYTLEELQAAVGGYIEIVRLTGGRLMVVNEEGKLQGLPANALASQLYANSRGRPVDHIVGNALVCRSEDIQ